MATKILQFSDLHLSPDMPRTVTNWEFCLELVRQQKPELVILSGDFVIDDPDRADHHDFAWEQLRRLSAPWVTVPGNHDVGDSVEDPYQDQPITEERRQRFVSRHGTDYWCRNLGDWRIIGINSMLPGSGLAAEAEQMLWLRQQASSSDRPTMLVLHKPLYAETIDEPENAAWAVPPAGRASILGAFEGSDLRIVISGHLHCYRHLQHGSLDLVWAPTTSITHQGKVNGVAKTTGWIEYVLDGRSIGWTHATSPKLRPIDLTEPLALYGAMRFAPVEALAAG